MLTYTEFAAKIKQKYPDYADIDDAELTRRIVQKYPDYALVVDTSTIGSSTQQIVSPEPASPVIRKPGTDTLSLAPTVLRNRNAALPSGAAMVAPWEQPANTISPPNRKVVPYGQATESPQPKPILIGSGATQVQGQVMPSAPGTTPEDVFGAPKNVKTPTPTFGEKFGRAVTTFTAAGTEYAARAPGLLMGLSDPKMLGAVDPQLLKTAEELRAQVSEIDEEQKKEVERTIFDSKSWTDPKNWGKTAGAVATLVTENAPVLMAAAVPVIGNAAIIGTEGGQWAEEAKKAGMDDEFINKWMNAYAVPSGLIEVYTDRFLTGAGKASGLSKVVQPAIDKVRSMAMGKLVAPVVETLIGSGVEGLEELLQGNSSDAIRYLALLDNAKSLIAAGDPQSISRGQALIDKADAIDLNPVSKGKIKQFLIGALVGGVVKGGTTGLSTIAEATRQGKEVLDAEEVQGQAQAQTVLNDGGMPTTGAAPVGGTQQPAPMPTPTQPGPELEEKTLQDFGIASPEAFYALPDKERYEVFDKLSPQAREEILNTPVSEPMAPTMTLEDVQNAVAQEDVAPAPEVQFVETQPETTPPQDYDEEAKQQNQALEQALAKAGKPLPKTVDELLNPFIRINQKIAAKGDPEITQEFKDLEEQARNKTFYSEDGQGVLGRTAYDNAIRNGLTLRDKMGDFVVGLFDIGNLGGGNTILTHRKMDEVIYNLGKSMMTRLAAEPGAKVALYKVGGDEGGFVVYGVPDDRVEQLMSEAEAEIEQTAKKYGLTDAPHPKHEGLRTGAGYVNWGIASSNDLDDIKNKLQEKGVEVSGDVEALIQKADTESYLKGGEKLVDKASKQGYIKDTTTQTYVRAFTAYAKGIQKDFTEGKIDEAQALDAFKSVLKGGTYEPGKTRDAAGDNQQRPSGETASEGQGDSVRTRNESGESQENLESPESSPAQASSVSQPIEPESAATGQQSDNTPSVAPSSSEPSRKTVTVEGVTDEVETRPTGPQIDAGNYKKVHIDRDGMKITIENPAGEMRYSKPDSPKKWATKMNHHYGYILGTIGKDKDPIDVFVNPDSPQGGKVYVVNQRVIGKKDTLDEHKVMLGFPSRAAAIRAYKSNYEKGWDGVMSVAEGTMEQFRRWAFDQNPKTKVVTNGFAEVGTSAPSSVKPNPETAPLLGFTGIIKSYTGAEVSFTDDFYALNPAQKHRAISDERKAIRDVMAGTKGLVSDYYKIRLVNLLRALNRSARKVKEVRAVAHEKNKARTDSDMQKFVESNNVDSEKRMQIWQDTKKVLEMLNDPDEIRVLLKSQKHSDAAIEKAIAAINNKMADGLAAKDIRYTIASRLYQGVNPADIADEAKFWADVESRDDGGDDATPSPVFESTTKKETTNGGQMRDDRGRGREPDLDDRAAERLRKSIEVWSKASIPQEALQAAAKPQRQDWLLADWLAGTYGARIVAIDQAAMRKYLGFGFSGVFVGNQPNTVFVSTENDVVAFSTATHELIHRMARFHPDLLRDLLDVMSEEGTAAFRGKIAEIKKAERATDALALEEFAAGFAGDEITRPDFWKRLYDRSPQAFKIAMNIVQEILNRVMAKVDPNTRLFKDIERVRNTLADVMVEYQRREAGEVPSDDSMQFQRSAFSSETGDLFAGTDYAKSESESERDIKSQSVKKEIQDRIQARKGGRAETEGLPLFGSAQTELQFSRRRKNAGDPQPDDKSLIAMHNLNQESVLFADKLGGLPAPSIAITKADIPFEKYGDVTLIAHKSMITPESMKIFDADIYSGRSPEINHDLNKKQSLQFETRLREARKKYENTTGEGNIEEAIRRSDRKRFVQSAKYEPVLMAMFLEDNGKAVAPVKQPYKPYPEIAGSPAILEWAKGVDLKRYYGEGYDSDYVKNVQNGKLEAIKKAVTEIYSADPELANDKELIDSSIEQNDRFRADRLIEEAMKVINGEIEIDKYNTRDLIEGSVKKIGEEKFQQWVDSLAYSLFINPHLIKNRKKVPVTLENMVDATISGGLKAQEETIVHGLGKARAAGASRLHSIEQIQSEQNRLMPGDQEDAIHDAMQKAFFDIQNRMSEYYKYSSQFSALDDLSKSIGDYLKGGKTVQNMLRALSKNDYVGVPDYLAEELMELADEIANGPTQYFEAKPERAVMLSEFAGAVIPKTASKEVRDVLRKNKIQTVEYDPTIDGDRTEKVKSFSVDDVRFQRRESPTFFSPTLRAAESLKQEKGSGDQMWAMIAKAPGVKKAETDWLGLEEWLKGKKSVTRQEIVDFVRANEVKVEEVSKGLSYAPLSGKKIYVYSDQSGNFLVEAGNESEAVSLFAEEFGVEEDDIESEYSTVTKVDNVEEFVSEYGSVTPLAGSQYVKQDSTKYSKYTLPGGENYREVLLSLPFTSNITQEQILDEAKAIARRQDEKWEQLGPNSRQNYENTARMYLEQSSLGGFKSSHWDENNVVAHTRLNDRTGPNGEKVLFIEEIQSDWAREARDEEKRIESLSQAKTLRLEELERKISNAELSITERDEWFRLKTEAKNVKRKIPNQPFLKNWEELVLKRILRMAAEEGYDRVAWINGEQTADRYDLSKQIESLRVRKDGKDSYTIVAKKNDGGVHEIGQVPDKDLEATVGKDMAQRIRNQQEEYHKYSGLDLKIGGEWAHNLYDVKIPQFLSKYGKKWGAAVENISLETGGVDTFINRNDAHPLPWEVHGIGGVIGRFATREEAALKKEKIDSASMGQQQQSITITDAMKESVLSEGQPMFQRRGNPIDQTNTSEFKAWFGDWESEPKNASKVVDENGKPLVVYHGTFNQFSSFDPTRMGENTDNNASDKNYAETAKLGFWFNTQPMGRSLEKYGAGYSMDMPVYLNIRNPHRERSLDWLAQGLQESDAKEYRDNLIDQGYDGIDLDDEEFGGTSYIAFFPSQIKSATGNIGTFDPENSDIRFQRRSDSGLKYTIPVLSPEMEEIQNLEREARRLRGKLPHIPEDHLLQRAQIELQMRAYDNARHDRIVQYLYDYARKIGLRGIPLNKVDTLLKNVRSSDGLLNAIKTMDETLESRKKSALYQKVLERVETILRRQNAIAAGKRQSTLTPEANDQLKKYIDSLRGGSPESKALLNRMMTYWNSYSKKDVIQGQNRPVETLDQVKDADIIEVLENPNLPLPQRVKDAMGDQLHSLDEMNAQQLIGVLRNIDQIENDGRIELRAEKEAQAAENERKAWEAADEVAGALVPQMSKVEAYKRATKKENQSSRQRTKEDAKTVWEKLFFGNIMAEMLIEGLAGFKPNSVFKRSVFTPIKKGVDAKLRGIKGAVEAFRDRYQGIDIEDARLTPLGRYTVKEYGENGQVTRSLTRTLTIENGMFVYAHAQNPSGLAHLYGTGLDEDVISTIIKDLPQKYKDAVDDQIDYYDTVQYPKMNEVFRAVNNIDMPKEERYFPINALDTNRAENTFLLDMIARLSTRASAVQKGMVKARVNSQAPFRSLSYFDAVTNNLLMTEHYVAMEQPIQQANRVLNHPAFRSVMREKSPVRLDLLRKWVNRMALGKVSISENDTHLTSILDKLRRNYAVFQLSLKIPSMIVQLSSGIRALAYVKPKYIQRALGKAFGELAPRSVDGKLVWPLMDFIHERSPSMENRMADYERELAEWAEKGIQRRILRTPVSGKRGAVTRVMERASSAYATAQEFTMWPMGAIDKGVASTIWMGKYLESLDSGMDENAAIEAADEVIRKTQSGGGLIALPENFAGSWLLRALSQFKSDPMKGLNLLYELASTAKEKGAVATTGTALVAFMLPAVFAYIVQHGGGLPWDEPEEWGKELVGSVTGGVPVFNALIESAMIGAGNVSKRLRGVKPGPGFEPKALDIPGLTGLLNIEKGLSKGKADKIAEGLIEIFGVPMGSQGLRLAESFTDPLTGDWREYIWSDYMLKQETVETTMIKKALSSKREDAKELAQYINKLEPNEKERFRVMVQIEEANRLLKKIEKAVVEKKIPKAVADTRRRLVKDRIRELKGKL